MVTDVIKRHWGPPVSKISNSRLSNQDRLPVCRILLLQRKPILGRTKPLGRMLTAGWT